MSDQIGKDVRLKQVYSQLERKYEEEQTQKLAEKYKLPYINLFGYPLDAAVLGLIPEHVAEDVRMISFFKEGMNVKVGVIEPSDKTEAVIKQLKSQKFFVDEFAISPSSFKHALASYNKLIVNNKRNEEMVIFSKEIESLDMSSLSTLGDELARVSATELVGKIMGVAIYLDASDVHLEPEPDGLKVRYRIDGVLQDVTILSYETQHNLDSRIKLMSKLKLNVTRVPQDGSFHLFYDKTQIDVRVSIIPSAFGESIVMRILRQNAESIEFENLGLSKDTQNKLISIIEKPTGMILTTGPTGSGKTTTLYAILNKLKDPSVKIITLEDPVEYRMTGVTQTPIDAASGMTMASGLKAVLRQDPDVVMVGEMRDTETAEISAQAALTGHLVLSTLHTNDAPSAIARLIDLQLKAMTITASLNAVVAQRLVRRVCGKCSTEYEPSDKMKQRVEMILSELPKTYDYKIQKINKFMHGKGCSACSGIGYKGRVGIYEIFPMSEEIEKLVLKDASSTEIRKQAIAEGMVTMAQDGIIKALAGLTDIEEVFRVVE